MQAKDWIRRALLPTSEERMTPEEAKRHPWLTEFFPTRQMNSVSGNNSPRGTPDTSLQPLSVDQATTVFAMASAAAVRRQSPQPPETIIAPSSGSGKMSNANFLSSLPIPRSLNPSTSPPPSLSQPPQCHVS